jgi:hypothetical protein
MTQSKSNSLLGVAVALLVMFWQGAPAGRSDDKPKLTAVTPTRLLQANNLTYLGMFRVPEDSTGGQYGFDFNGTGLAYNSEHDSLFIANHVYEEKVAEISIPALSTDVTQLSHAKLLQPLADITEGKGGNIASGGTRGNHTQRGGLFVYKGKLLGTTYEYYDAGLSAVTSHYTSGLTLSTTGDFKGVYKVGELNPGFYAGYMTAIPQEWQGPLGAPAITGACCYAIIARTSLGPSAFTFDPDKLGQVNPVPATPLVYYPIDHPTLGTWDAAGVNLYYNQATNITGVAFPTGTATVLFFGTIGTGTPCYGIGYPTMPLPANTATESYCYDPESAPKGGHAWPYKNWVWAYDANDLLGVRTGQKKPWDVRPYAIWELELPTHAPGVIGLTGVAYDPASQRLYVSQALADTAAIIPGQSPYARSPLIHVFQINNATPVPRPLMPQNLRIRR